MHGDIDVITHSFTGVLVAPAHVSELAGRHGICVYARRQSNYLMCVAFEDRKSFRHAPNALRPRSTRFLVQQVHANTMRIHRNLFAKPAAQQLAYRSAEDLSCQIPQRDVDTAHRWDVSHVVVHHGTHLLKMNFNLEWILSHKQWFDGLDPRPCDRPRCSSFAISGQTT